MKYIVYVETIDPVTWKINRDVMPVGYVVARGQAAAKKEARKKFNLGGAQRASLVVDPVEVNKLIAVERKNEALANKQVRR